MSVPSMETQIFLYQVCHQLMCLCVCERDYIHVLSGITLWINKFVLCIKFCIKYHSWNVILCNTSVLFFPMIFFLFGFALNRMSRNTFHLLLIPRSSTLRITKVCLNHNIKWKLLSSLLHKLCLLSMTAQRIVSRRQQKTNFKRRQNLTKK